MDVQGERDEPENAAEALRVLLVDDHDLFRHGLKELLQGQGVEVVGEVSSGEAGVRLAEQLAPDVVVMDLNMPGMTGVEATRQLAASAPNSRILVLTVSAGEGDLVDALVAGACGYLLKDAPVEAIVDGIRAAAAGESSLSPSVAAALVHSIRSERLARRAEPSIEADLSDRETQVLRLLAAGMSNAQIAEELVISPKTVKNHIANLLIKLKLENRIQAAVYAARRGLV